MEIAALLQRLQTDNTSGATTLVELALDILEMFVCQENAPEPAAFCEAFADLIGAVIAAQPSMAVMLNLAQQALQACASASPTVREHVQQSLALFRQELHASLHNVCQQALAIFPPQATVLTYSNSAMVIAALGYAQAHHGVRRVLLSESRPAYDGRQQAVALLQHGLQVEYTVDMALFERVPEVDLVVVGADAVFPHGLVNKMGTHALAQIARLHGVPFYSLCATHKFLPPQALPLLRIVAHPVAEVWPQPPAGLVVHNAYFDTTPLTLCRGIVHEHGVATPEALKRMLQQRQLAPALQPLVVRQT